MTDVLKPEPTPASSDEAEGISVEPITQWKLFWTRLRRHRLAMVSFVVLSVIVLIALSANLLPLNSPTQGLTDSNGRLLANIAPRADYPFGTDALGRDVLARVVHGGRSSLAVAGIVGLMVVVLGTTVGALAGYYGGAVDQALMRFVDLILGLPLLPVAIVAGRAFSEISVSWLQWVRSGVLGISILLGFLFWASLSRIVRAEFLSLREKEFVEAARAAGANDRRIIFRHILPNAMSPIIVQTTLILGAAIIVEAALSFLGFGVQPPTPTWGGMAAAGARLAPRGIWWELAFSANALIATVLAVNFIGDGLRDALDPTQTIERK